LAILFSMRFIHALSRAIYIAINQQRFNLAAVVRCQVDGDCSFAHAAFEECDRDNHDSACK